MKSQKKTLRSINVPKIAQQTDSHCGPAVVQMLLAFAKVNVTQDQVVAAAQIKRRIAQDGTRPAQMAKAIQKLAPELAFWFKQQVSVEELDILINQYRWPVAVNWQGLFYATPEEEKAHPNTDEQGHYSVVVGLNRAANTITIQDPYQEFSAKPRVFNLDWFEGRWWDYAKDVNPKDKRDDSIATERLAFVIVPSTKAFPVELGMKPASQLSELKQYNRFKWFLKVGFDLFT